jgi:RHS repeat-associated protein
LLRSQGITTYTYDANDRISTATTNGVVTTYTYDANGNTLTKTTGSETVTYDWDVQNRLISADTNGDGTTDVVNQYDSDGIRVSQTVNGQETRFLIDTNLPYAQVLEEYTPNGTINVSYVHGLDLISQTRQGETFFYHIDGLGSTRALTDETGMLTDRYLYDAGGQLIDQTGSTENSYLFAGEQRDPNLDLDYLRARYLDVDLGIFYGRDSFEGIFNDPITLNKYLYANSNPVMFIDPSGNISLVTFGIRALFVGGLIYLGTRPWQAALHNRSTQSKLGTKFDADNEEKIIYSGYGKNPPFGDFPLIDQPTNSHSLVAGRQFNDTSYLDVWELGPAPSIQAVDILKVALGVGTAPSIVTYRPSVELANLENGYILSEELTLNWLEYHFWFTHNTFETTQNFRYSLTSFTCKDWALSSINKARELDNLFH